MLVPFTESVTMRRGAGPGLGHQTELICWSNGGARRDNLYFLGIYDLFEETVYNIATSSVGAGSKANN